MTILEKWLNEGKIDFETKLQLENLVSENIAEYWQRGEIITIACESGYILDEDNLEDKDSAADYIKDDWLNDEETMEEFLGELEYWKSLADED